MKPAPRLLIAMAILLLCALLLGALDALAIELPAIINSLWWTLLILLGVAALIDAWLLHKAPSPSLERNLPGQLPLGRWSDVQLTLHHGYNQQTQVQLFDHSPQDMATEHLPQDVVLRPGEQTRTSYRVRPLVRGHFRFPRAEISLPSRLGLWNGRRRLELAGETRVYPDFARLHGAQLLAVDDWLSQIGVRQHQRRGLGMEFHQLREFRDGDSLRQIDWKATARKRTPIAREYQDERDQQLVFMLDCGRRMRSQDGELSHFDHALNASLLLSYIALRQGDAVGLSTFASDQHRYLAPVKGVAQLNVLLNAVYDLKSTQLPADYSAATDALLSRQRRRALVVIVTNLRDEDDQELLNAVKRLGRQHRVLVASLREEVLDALRQTPVQNLDSALAYCGTVDYLNARDKLHERLLANNVPVLDARPSELGPELVSRYLAWKKAGVI
ncbi:DUF58 domain-containing protein [Pseudomonas segetis]|uniref:Uncharacterized conserved protein, DUF58 family, contains vWF domain n=1 Tax=Pseudomonas segetis TaxID=298908 RepID=A0A239CKQ0_9PSED|nr:DUF58 domain-containing protein [Pseudomonas segetis]SNS20690.1 Uncharacterized conserved protein, DUF58 family, contains vWF domain [Pseudomonas segetis]